MSAEREQSLEKGLPQFRKNGLIIIGAKYRLTLMIIITSASSSVKQWLLKPFIFD